MTKKKSGTVSCASCEATRAVSAERIAQTGVTMIVLLAVYQIAKQFEFLSFSTTTTGDVVGLGTIFVIGLTASVSSCLAMVGGLLLSVTAAWDEAHPEASHMQRLLPQIHFNVGRILGYLVLGGVTGWIGKSLLLSVKATGYVKIGLSFVMIWLGLSILGFIPRRYCRLPLPRSVSGLFTRLTSSDAVAAPFLLGALTYFVPCGFTQSMQVMALGSGSFQSGALIMGIFALGTLPSLLGIGALSSFAEGKIGKLFFTAAGSASLLLGLGGVQSGLSLADINVLPAFSTVANAETDPNVSMDKNGQQVITVNVTNAGYSATSFTVNPDTPTWIYANVPQPLSGCLTSMVVPAYEMSRDLQKGANWIGPIKPTRDFAFMCSMGMFRADVHVRS